LPRVGGALSARCRQYRAPTEPVSTAAKPGGAPGHHLSDRVPHPLSRMAEEPEAGRLLAPQAWCRQRSCRDGAQAEHRPGDGCTCHADGSAVEELDDEPRLTILRLHASRLRAFACRACGGASQRMVEYPTLYFRCVPCALEDRWPDLGGGAGRG
jgi:hypothetical protein